MPGIITKVSDKINLILEKAAIILLAVVTALTFSGVIFRYAFGSPIIWLYETTLVLFSWVTFLGISIAVKRRENIHLDFVFHKISGRAAQMMHTAIAVISIVFFAIVFKDSIEIISETFEQKYNTIDLSTGWFYVPLFICSLVSVFHLICRLIEIAGGEK
jgi:TRAP-type C4-dicarboxylate transport system permease small subunit